MASQATPRGGMVEDAGAEPGLLDLGIARDDRAHPAHVDLVGPHGAAADDDAGIGGIVGDRVDDGAGLLRLRIDAQDAGIEDFERRRDVVRGVEHVEDADARPFSGAFITKAISASMRGWMKRS